MTDREKAIVMAHTGICMLTGDKFQIFHQYVENILGRPVQTIEMSMESVVDEIKEKSRDDFIALCSEEQERCGDCISRQAVLDVIEREQFKGDAISEIEKLPSVTPQQKMGRWIKTPKAIMGEGYMWYCDKCEYQVYQDSSRPYPSEKFCPNCGQPKMQEVKDETNN
jgi:rubrerythrin